jgi:hypothetical protein
MWAIAIVMSAETNARSQVKEYAKEHGTHPAGTWKANSLLNLASPR